MNLYMLVQDIHLPVPPTIKVVHNFGSEHVRADDGRSYRGDSMILSGDKEAFAEWLKQFDGVWISDNPMLGDWYVVHVKDDLPWNAMT